MSNSIYSTYQRLVRTIIVNYTRGYTCREGGQLMKHVILSLCLICILWISGCNSLGKSEKDIASHDKGISMEDSEQMAEDLMLIWSSTYDHKILDQAILEQIKRWNNEQEAIPFLINDLQLNGNEHAGIFRSAENWNLKGKNQAGNPFILATDEGVVTLEYDQHRETFVPEEFEFLLPIKHIQVVQNILSENKYEYLSWNKLQEGWLIDIRASIQPIEHVFSHYLSKHFLPSEEEMEYQLNGFSVLYGLQLEAVNEKWILKSVHFTLIKNEESLDQLHFHF